MDIPRQEIQEKKDYLKEIEGIRFIHYRDLHPTITNDDFQTCTKVDFKEVKMVYENMKEAWGRLQDLMRTEITYFYKSKSGSQYFGTRNGDLYRFADHWGATASCEWALDGTGELRMSVMTDGPLQIGVANLRDFVAFRRHDDRRRDILVNPEWKEKLKVIIPICETLRHLMKDPEFINLLDKDKQFLGESYGKFRGILKGNQIFYT